MPKLIVRAKHFKNRSFDDNCRCPLAAAAKELFEAKYVSEGVDRITIGDKTYKHCEYGLDKYRKDRQLADNHNFDDTVIRNIRLIPNAS